MSEWQGIADAMRRIGDLREEATTRAIFPPDEDSGLTFGDVEHIRNMAYAAGLRAGEARKEAEAVRMMAAVVEAAGGEVRVPDRIIVRGAGELLRLEEPWKGETVFRTRRSATDPGPSA